MEYAEEGTDAFIPRAKEIGVERLTLPAAIRDSKSDDERNSAHEADSTSESDFETEMNRGLHETIRSAACSSLHLAKCWHSSGGVPALQMSQFQISFALLNRFDNDALGFLSLIL